MTQTHNPAVPKALAVQITKELEASIAAVFSKHGLTAPKIKTTYGGIYKIAAEGSMVVLDESGIDIATPQARAYTSYGATYGLKEGLLGKTIRDARSGRDITFIGIQLSRRKFPLAFRSSDGRDFFYPENPTIIAQLNAS